MPELFICGDMVNALHQGGPLCDDALAREIASADWAIGNFEAPLRGHGQPQRKSGPLIDQPVTVLEELDRLGFDLLLLANNHIMDYGDAALGATLAAAERHGLATLGAGMHAEDAYRPLTRTFGELTVGMINACEAQFGVLDHYTSEDQAGYAWLNHPRLDRQIACLKRECDRVIVFAHAGLEHYPIPQQEWRLRYRQLCDLGADVIVGCHPHVPQGVEHYGNSLILYSLGNFLFVKSHDQQRDRRHPSFAVKLQLEQGRPVEFTPIFHHMQDGVVCLTEADDRVDLAHLDRLLEDDYQARQDTMSLEIHDRFIRGNLVGSLLPIPSDGTLKGSLRELAATLLGRRKHRDREAMALHLLRNETYYYALRRARALRFEASRRS